MTEQGETRYDVIWIVSLILAVLILGTIMFMILGTG